MPPYLQPTWLLAIFHTSSTQKCGCRYIHVAGLWGSLFACVICVRLGLLDHDGRRGSTKLEGGFEQSRTGQFKVFKRAIDFYLMLRIHKEWCSIEVNITYL